jgi:hypothetical protein
MSSIELSETLASMTVREPAPARGAEAPIPTGSDRFLRGREIGRGGMGRVVEAVDRQFNRVVALKEITIADSPGARRRFVTEAVVTGNLEHPGIPSVYERGLGDGLIPFYAMRRVQGRSLQDRLTDAKTLAERLALLPAVVKAIQTVAYAHERGVVHRDLKPANIIVGDHGDVVVLDWGLARVRGVPADDHPGGALSGGASSETQAGDVIGTPAYMPPEQARGENDLLDERTDVWALGALLYHVLGGRPPYEGKGLEAVLGAARAGSPAPLAAQVPSALRAICEQAMSRSRDARHPNAGALARAVEDVQSRALLERSSLSGLVAAGIVLGLLLVSGFMSFAMILTLPSLHEQGVGSLTIPATAALGFAIAVIEWRTRGKHRLATVVAAVALLCLVLGIGQTAANLVNAFGHAADEGVSLAQGLHESIGSVAMGAFLCAPLLMLSVILGRRARG